MGKRVGLGVLLATPYGWTAATYVTFIMAIYNVIKEEMERLHKIERNQKEKEDAERNIKNDKKRQTRIEELTDEANQWTTGYDKEMAEFVQALIGESRQVLGDDDWVDKMGPLWHILKFSNQEKKGKKEKANDQYKLDNLNEYNAAMKRKSVVHLLKLIRDKIEHIRTYNNNIKKLLTVKMKDDLQKFFYKDHLTKFFDKNYVPNFFTTDEYPKCFDKNDFPIFFDMDANTGQLIFNENNFIAFWISKFPKLMPFLWIKFYKFKDQLKNYYPEDTMEINRFQVILLDPTKFNEELKCALFRDMENGNVVKRFQVSDGGSSLEIRGFHNLTKVLDKNSFIKLVLDSKDGVALSVFHSSTSEKTLDYAGTEAGTETVVLLCTNDIANEKMWEKCNVGCADRIIVFSDPDKLSNDRVEFAKEQFIEKINNERDKLAVKQFIEKKNIDKSALTECPVNGSELSVETQNWILNEGHVSIQGRDTKIRDIFPESNINDVMGLLSGPFLNKLLKREMPKLCSEYQYPEYKGVYIERKIRVSEKREFLEIEKGYTGVMIRTPSNSWYESQFDNFLHGLCSMYKIEGNLHVIFLQEPRTLSKGMIYECTDFEYWQDLRSFEFNENNTVMSSPVCKLVKEWTSYFSERELVQKIIDKKVGTVCFHAESGMGKSKLLISLGKRLEQGLVNFCPFRTFVDLLEKKVKNRDVSRADVKSVILEILKCNDNVERDLIDKWLERKGNQGEKIELELDGLDEVPRDSSSLALKVCEIIEQNFDSIRLWITCHKPFPSTRESSEIAYCALCPFSDEDQIEFFELSWKKKEGLTQDQVKEAAKMLLTHFNSFTDGLMPGEFLGYPFNCSMLAENFEDRLRELIKRERALFKGSVIDFYDNIFHKRFAKMLEKEKIDLRENSRKFEYLKRDYHQLHTYFALKLLFPESSDDFNEPEGIKIDDYEDDFTQMGFITGIYPISFLHLMYAHYFVATHIFKVIETGSLDNLCSKEAFENLLYYGFPTPVNEIDELPFCWVLVDKYLDGVSDWNNLKWWKAKKTSLDSTKKREKMSLLLAYAIQNKLWNLASLLIDLWVDETNESVCNQVLELAKKYQPSMKWFIKMCKLLHYNNQDEVPKCSDKTFFYDVIKYLVKTKCGNEVFDKIAEMRKSEGGGGIFHCLVDKLMKEYSWGNAERILEDTKTFIQFVHKMNKEEINRKNNHGRNFLLAIPFMVTDYFMCFKSEHWFKLIDFLIEELGADINERTDMGESVLSLENYDLYREKFADKGIIASSYNQMLMLLKQKKNFAHINLKREPYGFTPLLEAVYVFGKYLSADTLLHFREMDADFNATDKDGNTALDICHKMCRYRNFGLATLIIHFGKPCKGRKTSGRKVEEI